MVSKTQPDWPPPGWKAQIKVKNGRKIKYYIHSKTRQKFYSKPAVLRHIKDGSVGNDRSYSTKKPSQKNSQSKQMQLAQANESLQWLPDGWTVELRIRKSGSRKGTEYKCFVDATTGYKCFSKPEVFRYLESKQDSGRSQKERGSSRHSSSNRSIVPPSARMSNLEPNVSQILKTRVRKSNSSGKKVVVERSVDDDLPSGWIKETRKKVLGNQEVRKDLFYFDPASGLVFRSKLEVLRYVETGEVSRHAYRRRNCNVNTEELEIEETSPRSSVKKQRTDGATRKKLLAGEGSTQESTPLVPEAKVIKETGVGKSNRSSSRVRPSSVEQCAMLCEPTSTSLDMLPAKLSIRKNSAAEETVNTNEITPWNVQGADSEEKDSSVMETKPPPVSLGDMLTAGNPVAVVMQDCSNGKVQGADSEEKDSSLMETKPPPVSSWDMLTVENPVAVAIQDCSNGKTQNSKKKTKDRRLPSVPCRSSKRLAGVDAQVVFHSIPIEHALRATSRKSTGSKPIPTLGSTPINLQEKPLSPNSDTQNVLASQEAEHGTLDVDTQMVLATQGVSSNNSYSLTLKDPEAIVLQQSPPGVSEDSIIVSPINIVPSSADSIKTMTVSEIDHPISIPEGQPDKLLGRKVEKSAASCPVPEQQPASEVEKSATQTQISNRQPDTVLGSKVEKSAASCRVLEQQLPSEVEKLDTQSQSSDRQPDTHLGNKVEKSAASCLVPEQQLASIGRDTEQSVSGFNYLSPLWSDPCLEFAYKTLTGAIPLDDNLAIQDYIQHQLRTSEQDNDNHSLPDIVPSFFENDETKLVSPLPEEVSLPNSNGFSSHKRSR